MNKIRVIARIDVKNEYVIKGIHLEGLRKVGNPNALAKKISYNKWEAYIDNSREPTGKDFVEWAKEVEMLGAGEIMLTSIDKEETKKGFDIRLNHIVSQAVSIPVISMEE